VLREAVSVEELRTWLDGPTWSVSGQSCICHAGSAGPGRPGIRVSAITRQPCGQVRDCRPDAPLTSASWLTQRGWNGLAQG
jgi:hypothetical protein